LIPKANSRVITIDRGSLVGVLPDEGVVNDDGIVGRVTRVAPFYQHRSAHHRSRRQSSGRGTKRPLVGHPR